MKKVSFVSRWPLAVGLSCALYGWSAKPAIAGSWQPVDNFYSLDDCLNGDAKAIDAWSQILQGTMSSSGMGELDWIPWFYFSEGHCMDQPYGGKSAFAQHDGRFGGRYRWVPNLIWDSGNGKYIDDPDDKVPEKVFFKLVALRKLGEELMPLLPVMRP